jgi:hypothetical protein
MGSSKAPKTPDYTGAAQVQAQSDKDIAQYLTKANRVNQIDPYGTTTWTQTPSTSPEATQAQFLLDKYKQQIQQNPGWDQKQVQAQLAKYQSDVDAAGGGQSGQWTQTTSLTAPQQHLLEQQQLLQSVQNSRIGDLLKDFKTPEMAAQRQLQTRELAQRDLPAQRQLKQASMGNIGSIMYDQMTRKFGDRFADEEASQRAQLANQGFQQGSEGYTDTIKDFTNRKNEAYQDAASQAALATYGQYNTERGLNQGEYNTLAGDDLARYGAQTNNDLNRFSALSSNDLNQFNALSGDDTNRYNSQMGFLSQLLGGVQAPTTPQYQPYAQATQYQGADLMGAMQGQYQGDLNKTNAKNANNSNLLQTGGVLAGAAAVAF